MLLETGTCYVSLLLLLTVTELGNAFFGAFQFLLNNLQLCHGRREDAEFLNKTSEKVIFGVKTTLLTSSSCVLS